MSPVSLNWELLWYKKKGTENPYGQCRSKPPAINHQIAGSPKAILTHQI